MFPPFWGFPPTANVLLEQLQRELERMHDRFDAVFNAALDPDPAHGGQTPADVVFTENKLRLLHYRPIVAHPHPIPLLIVPSVINRSYVLDLLPGRSLVEHLIGQGFDVYMLDWGIPGSEDRLVTFDHYISGYLQRAVRRICALSGAKRISLLGYSIGGTFAAIFTALWSELVQNLILLAAPINFHDTGLLSQWTRKERFNVDLIVDTLGTMPTELMRASFRMLKPTRQIAQSISLAEKIGDTQAVQDFLAMQSWMSDTFPLPNEAYRTYIKECYQENHLIQGKLVIDRQRVDLAHITCPLLTITAAHDRICLPQSAAIINDLVASTDKHLLEMSGGHMSIVLGRNTTSELWPQLSAWLIERSAAPAATSDLPTATESHDPRTSSEETISASVQSSPALAASQDQPASLAPTPGANPQEDASAPTEPKPTTNDAKPARRPRRTKARE